MLKRLVKQITYLARKSFKNRENTKRKREDRNLCQNREVFGQNARVRISVLVVILHIYGRQCVNTLASSVHFFIISTCIYLKKFHIQPIIGLHCTSELLLKKFIKHLCSGHHQVVCAVTEDTLPHLDYTAQQV